MKNRGYFVFGIILLLFLISFSFILAIDPSNPDDLIEDSVGIDPENLTKIIQDPDSGTSYLTKEWIKIIKDSKLSVFFSTIEKGFRIFDPFFRLVLGMSFSWTLMFFLTFLFWFSLVYFSWGLSFLIEFLPFSLNKSKNLRLITFIIFLILFSFIRLPRYLSIFSLYLLEVSDTFIFKLLSLGILALIIYLIFLLSDTLKSGHRDLERDKKISDLKKQVNENSLTDNSEVTNQIERDKEIEKEESERARRDMEELTE